MVLPLNRIEVYSEGADYTVLLEKLKTFDLDAFEMLYTQSRERLFAYALSILKDEDAARDLVQELFVDFWEEQIFLNIHTGLASYLVRSVRNRCLDYIKKEQNWQRLRNELFHIQERSVPVNGKIASRELGKEIDAAIAKLPPMPAKVFCLHYKEKLSYAEIAAQLQLSPHTISNHMTKALKILRENLKKI